MRRRITTNDDKKPSFNLAINKSRLKNYNVDNITTYYLKDGDEFQLEIFNPLVNNILAKIKINNNFISQGGLVIKPGERIFLERYLDVSKKFLFETYEVEDSDEVREAIENNGLIEVEFFNEVVKPRILLTSPRVRSRNIYGGPFNQGGYMNNNFYNANLNGTGDLVNTVFTTNSTYSEGTLNLTSLSSESTKSIETGRVEMGDDSNQKLTSVDLTFSPIDFSPKIIFFNSSNLSFTF